MMSSEPIVPLNSTETEDEAPDYVSPAGSIDHQLPERATIHKEAEVSGPGGLHDTTEAVGAAMGRAVGKVKDLPRRVSEMKERFTVIRGRGREEALSRADELKENAKQRVTDARTYAAYYSREYPLQFIAAVGAAGFVLGMILRMWRSSRRA
jgi:ElaB/YqjD/DUF883 family membrane-anchored ribosome-binding protein